jgi:hypothetical protein
MALTIYSSARSRTMRVLWAAEELGLDYEHVPYEFDADLNVAGVLIAQLVRPGSGHGRRASLQSNV